MFAFQLFFFSSILCYMQVLLVTKCLCVLCLFNIFLMLSSWVMINVYFWNIFVLTECNALNCLDGMERNCSTGKNEVQNRVFMGASSMRKWLSYLEHTQQLPLTKTSAQICACEVQKEIPAVYDLEHLCEGKLFMSVLNCTSFLAWSSEWCTGSVFYGSSGKKLSWFNW